MPFFRLLCWVSHTWALLTVAEPQLVHTGILSFRLPLLELNFYPIFCWVSEEARSYHTAGFVVLLFKVAALQLVGRWAMHSFQDRAPAHSCAWPGRNRDSCLMPTAKLKERKCFKEVHESKSSLSKQSECPDQVQNIYLSLLLENCRQTMSSWVCV